MSNVNNLDDCGEKKRSFGSFWEGLLCAVLQIVVATCLKRVLDFVRIRSFLVKTHLSLISREFLIFDIHRQLVWWNIVVGNFRPNLTKLLTIALQLTSCWWHNKHVSHWQSQQFHFLRWLLLQEEVLDLPWRNNNSIRYDCWQPSWESWRFPVLMSMTIQSLWHCRSPRSSLGMEISSVQRRMQSISWLMTTPVPVPKLTLRWHTSYNFGLCSSTVMDCPTRSDVAFP